MTDIIAAKFTNFDADDSDYPDTSNILKMSSFPKPIPTKSSQLMKMVQQQAKEAEVCIHLVLNIIIICYMLYVILSLLCCRHLKRNFVCINFKILNLN